MKKLFTLFIITVFASNAFTQPPRMMSYQCVVRDNSGELITKQSIGVRTSILRGNLIQITVFQETYTPNPSTNENGLLTLQIGSGTASTGDFSKIDWSNGPYFLRTEMDPKGGTSYTISGQSQILSVPYALYAEKTGSVAGSVPDTRTLTINGTALNLSADRSWNVGSVTSVGLSLPGIFTLAGSPVTSSGTLTAILNSQPANHVLASPNGSSGIPDFRVLVTADIPNLDWSKITSGKPTTLTGYGITDAFSIEGDQTISGIKTFSNDLLVNGLTIGKGNNSITSNTALGLNALKSNTTGYYNIATGFFALNSNTTGYYNTAFGPAALAANSTGNNNTAIGYLALSSSTTSDNTAIGSYALKTNTSGFFNTATGCYALEANTTGYGNTANGYKALINNTEGSFNTAIGTYALYVNTIGNKNTAIGFSALFSNTTGLNNTANGSDALKANTTGDYNTAVGESALAGNSTGNHNTAIGNVTLALNTTGYSNTAVGYAALHGNATGFCNTAIGLAALNDNTTGTFNTATGYSALSKNTEGTRNTANGTYALYSNTTGSNNTATGYSALYTNTTGNNNTAVGDNSLVLNTTGSNNTAVGIHALHSNTTGYNNSANGFQSLYSNTIGSHNTANGYNALEANTTGNNNTAIGEGALYKNSSGSFNTAIGLSALGNNTTGNENVAIGLFADVASENLTNATVIGCNAVVNASNKVRIGNSNVTVIEGQVNWSVGSDIRLKDNIVYSDRLGLEFINCLKTATFTYKDDPGKRHHDGLIAQDVKETLDRLGLKFSGIVESNNEEKTFNLSYAEFVIPLINSVKELSNKNQEQQKQIEELKALVSTLIANQTVPGKK